MSAALDVLAEAPARPEDERVYWLADRKEWRRALEKDLQLDPDGFDAWRRAIGRPLAEEITSAERVRALDWLTRGGVRLVKGWLRENPGWRRGRPC